MPEDTDRSQTDALAAPATALAERLPPYMAPARFEALALEPLPSTPEQMREFWLAEKKRWGDKFWSLSGPSTNVDMR